uniref:5'-nucleotidase n=1 Tax=Aureoumbra lagunensis TaxID=44058 RepID=A0A7S3K410_9STRA|mmetsp:Transcript_8477/g.12969  ORF Transcript_8477/g.12969 Transcript_8477/m.12969 type:complete len:567 (+) Transcript_8477:17-1717(+)
MIRLIVLFGIIKTCSGLMIGFSQRRGVYNKARAIVEEERVMNEIFCNRELNMKHIAAVGFDMDYTLASYNYEFDLLAFEGAKKKLIEMGYPASAIQKFEFDPDSHQRGLVIDKLRGNILKVDRHKYTRTAYHGSCALESSERKRAYVGVAEAPPLLVGDDFVNVDSLFQLIDASLYAQVIDALDNPKNTWTKKPSYRQAYSDVRSAVDSCHHDGVIKDRVAQDPAKYILPDPKLQDMLRNFKKAGKQVFLLTNSLFDYTNVVMNFLTNAHIDSREWIKLFDFVIVGAGKPTFLSPDAKQRQMLRVDISTNLGTLHNLRGKPVQLSKNPMDFIQREGRVFQGGNYKELHALLGIDSGSQILYVGDHMYGDVVRSKRSLGWRTMLVVPELDHELEIGFQTCDIFAQISQRQKLCEAIEIKVDALRLAALNNEDIFSSSIRSDSDTDDNDDMIHHQQDKDKDLNHSSLLHDLQAAETERLAARDALRIARHTLAQHYHPIWGPMFRTGNQASRFAKQVLDYACIYTSRVSNLSYASPNRHWRPPSDAMPHDRRTGDAEQSLLSTEEFNQ